MICCTLKQFFLGLLFGSTFLYAGIALVFQYKHVQTCDGDWGKNSPPMELKNGKGICTLTFELSLRVRPQPPLLLWKSSYSGLWRNGMKDGRGTFLSLSGSKYEGFWKENARSGQGTFLSSDGTEYQGQWIEDTFTGDQNLMKIHLFPHSRQYRDACVHCLNESFYIGQVKNGLMDGEGMISLADRKDDYGYEQSREDEVPLVFQKRTIQGKFSAGLLQGSGTIILRDGTPIRIVDFTNSWDIGLYKSHGLLNTMGTLEKPQSYEWDGTRLLLVGEENLFVSSMAIPSPSMSKKEKRLHDLYEVMNTLKWFEFHFIFKKLVESEPYTFEFVDPELREKKDEGKEDEKEL